MGKNSLILDWHETCTAATEEACNKKIGYTILGDAKWGLTHGMLWKLGTFMKLLAAKTMAERNLKKYHEGKKPLKSVYRPFNLALLGQSVRYVNGIIDEFAKQTANMIDDKVVGTARRIHDKGSFTGILSVANRYGIDRTLKEAGYPGVFDRIVANRMRQVLGRSLGMTLGIYGRKGEVMKSVYFDEVGLDPKTTYYMGDTDDDVSVAELLPTGNFIVPFLASEDFRESMARELGAFVPDDRRDLQRYVEKK